MKIEIITRCTRPTLLNKVLVSILANKIPEVDLHWHIIVDTSVVKTIDTGCLTASGIPVTSYFWEGVPGDMGHSLINRVIDKLYADGNDSWIYILDDDNEIHPDFFSSVYESYETEDVEGMIFSQYVGGKDFTKLEIREAKPENVKVQKIDMGQFLLHLSLIGDVRFAPNQYIADGLFIEEIYSKNPDNFVFIDKVLCNYNSLQVLNNDYFLPKVLLLGSDKGLSSIKVFDYEDTSIRVKFSNNATAIADVTEFNPDCILTVGESYAPYKSLSTLSYDFRQRWIHSGTNDSYTGENAYSCAMNYILNSDTNNLVSIATPIYNTGEKLRRTYQSLLNQSHNNWEWVLVNDSTDTITLKIAEDLAKTDPRIRVYDFKEKSKGIIGEVKYRTFALTKGAFILELDHDDYLLPHALERTVDAFNKYPDAGFVYSDCAEIDENYNSLTYGDGFSFGYGSYREETHMGIVFKVANTANINPLTIRHIVGVPNHLRAWRRDVYFKIGGHNRRLSIADDYELVVRTFLETKFAKIAECCYLQFYHGGNSQELPRADIQRRVRTISTFYTGKINERFKELGVEDWAYIPNSLSWNVPPRTGDEENYVNYIL